MSNFDFVDRKFILEFLRPFKEYDISVEKKPIDPNKLKRSQRNQNPEKAKDIINKIKSGEYDNSNEGLYSIPIIVSSDNYVINAKHKDVLELLNTHDKSAVYYEIEKQEI